MSAKSNNMGASTWQMTLMGLRYLNGRRLRTTLTTLAIVFGVALIFAINISLPALVHVFDLGLSAVSGADISMVSVSGEGVEADSVLPVVAGVENVEAATGILRRQFSLPSFGGDESLGSATQIELIGIDPTSAQNVRQYAMSEGRFLEAGDNGAAVFPAGIADFSSELTVGTRFPLITAGGLQFYTVVGLLAEQGSPTAPQIYVSLEDAQQAFNQPGLINQIEVAITPGADRAAVIAAISSALGGTFEEDSGTSGVAAVTSIQLGFVIFDMLGVLALFLGAFLIFNTFRTVVIERRRDIGMLRAIGATQRQITLMIVIESLIQGAVGTVIGLIVGYFMAMGMFVLMGPILQDFMHITAPQPQITPTSLALPIGLGLLTALIAAYLPARSAGKTSPLEALRPATLASVERAARWSLIVGAVLVVLSIAVLLSGGRAAIGGSVLFLLGMVIAAPGLVIPAARLFAPLLTLWFAREGELARGNLVRQPSRAAITGSTLMIGLAIIVLAAALVTGFNDLVTKLADRNFSSDIILLPQTIAVYNNVIGADESLATRLREIPNVETVGTLRYAASSANDTPLQVLGIDPQVYPQIASFEFTDGDANTAFTELGSGRNALITSIGTSALGVNVGDDVVLQTAEGPQTYHIIGVANDILTFKVNAVFISQANLAADFHKTEDIMVMLNVVPGADEAAVLTQVEAVTADYPQFTAHLTGEYRDQMVQTTSGAMVMFYGIAILILIPAALGLLNTLTINILERTREIGVVRAVGGSRGQVRRIVTGEALLLGIFSASLGVLAGVALSYGVIGAFGAIGWEMPYQFPIIGVIAAIVIGVLLALFSSILPARSAAKLDIVRALQYE